MNYYNYKSWSGLRKKLEEDLLAESLRGRVQYFCTAYHTAHDYGGRVAVRVDGKELVQFTWADEYAGHSRSFSLREQGMNEAAVDRIVQEEGLLSDGDFIVATWKFFDSPIAESLESDNLILRLLAILDRRVGKRTLEKVLESGEWEALPTWLKQFYCLRFEAEGLLK